MKKLWNLASSSFLVKLFLSFTALIAVLIGIIGGIFFYAMNLRMEQQARQNAMDVLSQSIHSVEFATSQIDSLGYSLTTNSDVWNFIKTPSNMTKDQYLLSLYEMNKTLTSMTSSMSFVHSVAIYSRLKDQVFMSNQSIWEYDEYPDAHYFDELLNSGSVLRRVGAHTYSTAYYKDIISAKEDVVSVFIQCPLIGKNPFGVIQLNISADNLNKLVYQSSMGNGSILILNQEGELVLGKGGAIDPSVIQKAYMESRTRGEPVDNGFSFKWEDKAYVAFFKDGNTTDWRYIYYIQKDQYTYAAYSVGKLLILLCALVLGIGVLLAIPFSVSNYRPLYHFINSIKHWNEPDANKGSFSRIAELRDLGSTFEALYLEKNTLEKKQSGSQMLKRERFMADFITCGETEGYEEEYKYYKNKFRYPYFVAVAIYLKESGKSLPQALINGFFADMEGVLCDVAALNPHEWVVVLNLWDYMLLDDRITQFVSSLASNCECSPLITVGSVVAQMEEIYLSYREAVYVRRYSLSSGNKEAIFYGRPSGKQFMAYYEIFSTFDRLTQVLSTLDYQKVLDHIRPAFETFESNALPNDVLQQAYIQFHYQILNFLKMNQIYSESIGLNDEEINTRFESFSDVYMVEEDMRATVNNVLSLVKSKKKNKYTDAINQLKTHIEADIGNVDLSLQLYADMLHLSVPFLSKLFKDETQENFSDYVTRLRMEKAISLLKNGKLPINRICEKCGYKNVQNFIRTFKAHTGLTPGNYREQIVAEHLAKAVKSISEEKSEE